MASKLLITLAIVLVLTHDHAPPTVGLTTHADPKDAGAQQGVVQGEAFRLNHTRFRSGSSICAIA